jgi:hypothetical protein
MPKVKISEYSATANSNTDVASINIDEGCAPSGINNAIRAIMGHLKDFQQGTNGDPFNGPVNGTLGATTPSTASVTTLTTSSTVTHNGGTANGVAYLNGSKALTTGSALVFDGTNLGVGASPAQTLHVKTSTSTTPITLGVLSNATGLPALSFNGAYASSTMAGIYSNGATSASLYYEVPSGNSHFFGIADSTKMTLDASGNLLVGTTSLPSGRKFIFEASGDTTGRINSGGASSGLSLEFANNGTLRGGIGNGSGNITSGAAADMAIQANANLVFASGGYGEKARIDSSGNLLVGTTSNNSTSRTVIRGTQNILNLDNAGGQFTTLTYSNNDVAKAYVYYDNTNTRTYVQTGATGGVYLASGGTSWTAVSDERTKDIIEPIENATQKIANWRTVVGKYKTDADSVRRSFLIAQDVLTTFPEAVDATNVNEYGLNYQDLIPVLVAAIKEQSALITQLTARITALESA